MTGIKDIDYFVFCHGFYFTNRVYPVEIGISEIQNYRSTQVIPVDLGALFETVADRVANVNLIKNVHGIESAYLHRLNLDEFGDEGYYGIKYRELPATMKKLFTKKITVFAVKGADQKKMLSKVLGILNNADYDESYSIIDIEEAFGCRMPVCSYLKSAPTLHKGFHESPFEDACAAKIAYNYAEFLRDRIKFGEPSLYYCSYNDNGDEEIDDDDEDCQIIDEVEPQQQQQQNPPVGQFGPVGQRKSGGGEEEVNEQCFNTSTNWDTWKGY